MRLDEGLLKILEEKPHLAGNTEALLKAADLPSIDESPAKIARAVRHLILADSRGWA